MAQDAIARARQTLDDAHTGDPETETERPAEQVYADRIERWVRVLIPAPTPALQLAARAQHLERWTIPREQFPEGRGGYLKWRSAMHARQAERAAALVTAAGCEASLAARVGQLVGKRAAKEDPEAQALEDAACLVFLEHELEDFRRRYPDEKTVDVLRKTWGKMSRQGRDLALGLALPEPSAALVRAALQPAS